MGTEVANSVVAHVDALLESVMREDGLGGLGEVIETGVAGLDPVRGRLALMRVLAADVARRVASDDPFEDGATGEAIGSGHQSDQTEAWEQAVAGAHTVINQVSAVRARCVAECARRDEGAADELAPVLRLGTYEADRLVEGSTRMVERAPRLLDEVAAGSANLSTVAAIAGECRDARPETCERVEDEVGRRGLHRAATKTSARRSARTLVKRYETAAARVTAKKTAAQQTGVWLDPHPNPGLALLSAVMPSADAEALMTAVEDHATKTHRDQGGDGRLLGQHRAAALTDLALRNVTLTAHLELMGAAGIAGRDSQGAEASVVLAPKAGPIAASDLARVLAAHAGSRKKSVTIGGVLLDSGGVSAPAGNQSDQVGAGASATIVLAPAKSGGAYRPPKSLRELVIRRDGHCRFPGCHRPGKYTDLDHVIPWPNGPTALANLQCLCRRHHQAKQHGWEVTMTSDRTCTWTSPTGRAHTTHPRSRTDADDLVG